MFKLRSSIILILFGLQACISLKLNISTCYKDVKHALDTARESKKGSASQLYDNVLKNLNIENKEFCSDTKNFKNAKGFTKEQKACFMSSQSFYAHHGLDLPEAIKNMFVENHISQLEVNCKGVKLDAPSPTSSSPIRKKMQREISNRISRVTSNLGKFPK